MDAPGYFERAGGARCSVRARIIATTPKGFASRRERRAPRLLLAAVALSLAASARAEWAVASSETDSAVVAGVEHRRIALAESASGAEATLDLASFSSKRATLRVIDAAGGSGSLASTMQRERCLAGVNGGYFDPNDAPVGLLISDGRMIAPLRKARLLSGVLSVVKGRVQIQRTAEFSAKSRPSSARQCGPFLVKRGQPVTGLSDTRTARRTFVATSGAERAAIGYSSPVTLAQLAKVLATPGVGGDVRIQRALNLDGGSSSAFWFAGENGAFSIPEQKTVRDFVAVVPR